MREILFRGKMANPNHGLPEPENRWVYGVPVPMKLDGRPTDRIEMTQTHRYDKIHHYQCSPECEEIITETLGQFTGLLDKNGKKIFEGDIVRAMMDYGPAGMIESVVDIGFKQSVGGYRWNYFDKNTIEVIGNVYDNPSPWLELIGNRYGEKGE